MWWMFPPVAAVAVLSGKLTAEQKLQYAPKMSNRKLRHDLEELKKLVEQLRKELAEKQATPAPVIHVWPNPGTPVPLPYIQPTPGWPLPTGPGDYPYPVVTCAVGRAMF